MKVFPANTQRLAGRSLFIILLLIPLTAAAFKADNIMIDPGVAPIKLDLAPEPGMSLNASELPNAVLAPFRFSSETWPAFLVEHRTVQYVVAVSCGEQGQLPCSTLYVPNFNETDLTVRFVQSTDDTFISPEGLRIGSLFEDVIGNKDPDAIIFSGNGECVQLESGWNACFYKDDLMMDPQTGQYRPQPNTRIHRFIR